MKPIKKLPTSWLRRGLGASATALELAGRTALGRARKLLDDPEAKQRHTVENEVAMARVIVSRLGAMKGLLMKAGQVMSFMAPSLSEEAKRVLAQLQGQTDPMAPEVVEQVITEELGKPPRELFADWSPIPFAAASIGQVHRAQHMDGRPLAVKVQYPAIEQAIAGDLRNAAIMNFFGSIVFRSMNYDEMMAEFRQRILEECDYTLEASHQRRFHELWSGREDVLVPEVLLELSSRRVLTTELVEGRSFQVFAATATQAERDAAGQTMMRFAYESILRHFMFNCDPHPGNYLYLDGQVAFLDFGSVKTFEPGLVATWRGMLIAVMERDMSRFRETAIELGIVPDPDDFDFEAQFRIAEYLSKPWLSNETFHFDDAYLAGTFPLLIFDNPNKFKMKLPPHLLFLNRLQWGLYAVLGTLRASGNYHVWMRDLIYAEVSA